MPMKAESHTAIRITRRIAAPPDQVFDAWLDRKMIGQWMFGPAVRDEAVVRISLDPRVGGAFSFVVRRQGQEIDHVGRYLELDRPRRLAFTWGTADTLPETSRVVVDILRLPGGAEVTLGHELHPDWAEQAGRTEEAWIKMLDSLAETLSKAS
jgi:uncharacterized protein YndB with AHSA1/START domain